MALSTIRSHFKRLMRTLYYSNDLTAGDRYRRQLAFKGMSPLLPQVISRALTK